jgi:hypothetical protein
METAMAKGQKKSNREPKKPKQVKKPAVPQSDLPFRPMESSGKSKKRP